ncbi:Histidine kinase [compost metagenome]
MGITRNKLSLYWKCQLIGWSLTALFWSYQAYFQGSFNYLIAAAHLFLDLSIGIGITHTYRRVIKQYQWLKSPLKLVIWKIVFAVTLMSILYMLLIVVKNFCMQQAFNSNSEHLFLPYFKFYALSVWVTGARLLSIWVLAYHLYHYAQREIRISQENAQLNVLAKEAQLANLQTQIDPHFLFNSLNNIKALIPEQPLSARRAIDLLSELLRSSLSRKSEWTTIQDELELIKDYLELERFRFEERLVFEQQVDEQSLTLKIPPFSLQTLVENAIKHGISQRKDGGLIKIEISKLENRLIICVHNTGKINSTTLSGIGIRNLKDRLALQFDPSATFELKQENPDTVIATLNLPVYA